MIFRIIAALLFATPVFMYYMMKYENVDEDRAGLILFSLRKSYVIAAIGLIIFLNLGWTSVLAAIVLFFLLSYFLEPSFVKKGDKYVAMSFGEARFRSDEVDKIFIDGQTLNLEYSKNRKGLTKRESLWIHNENERIKLRDSILDEINKIS